MIHKGKTAVVEDAFIGAKTPRGSGSNTPARSRVQSPAASAAGTPVARGIKFSRRKRRSTPHRYHVHGKTLSINDLISRARQIFMNTHDGPSTTIIVLSTDDNTTRTLHVTKKSNPN